MPRLDGPDIAHYQWEAGPVDLEVTQQIPTFWFAQKATQSTQYVDPTFNRSRAEALGAGFSHRGFYHWLSSTKDVPTQAAHYLNTMGNFLLVGEFAMLDAEERGITVDMCLTWCEHVESHTRRPVAIYTGAYVAGGTIWQSTALRKSLYGPRPMHIAAYTTEAKMLALPGVKAYPQDAWQFSSNGPVAGIVGRCDMNRIDNRAAFDLACGIRVIPTEPEDDMQLMQVAGDAAVILINGDASWVNGDSSGLGPVRTVTRETYKNFYFDGPEPDYGNGPGNGPTKLSDFKGRRPQPTVTIPPIVVPPLTGHISADINTADWHITGTVG